MKEIINYNKDGIRNITFHYIGTEKELDMFMRLIIKDCVISKIKSLSKDLE